MHLRTHLRYICRSILPILLLSMLLSIPATADTPPVAKQRTSSSEGGDEAQPLLPTGSPVMQASAELLHGAWRVDMMAAIEANSSGMSPEEEAMMRALMGTMEITFTFSPAGSASMAASGMGQKELKLADWAPVTTAGASLTFTLTEYNDDGTLQPPETFTAMFVDDYNLVLSKDGESDTMPLIRVGTPNVGPSPVTAAAPPAAGPSTPQTPPARPVAGMPIDHATAELLVGAWAADMEQMVTRGGANLSEQERQMMRALMSSMQVVFELQENSSCTMTVTAVGETEIKTGTWEVSSSEGNAITFTITPTRGQSFSDDPGDASGPITYVATFVDSHNVEFLRVEEEESIPFYRID
jgi:hypothetical protein